MIVLCCRLLGDFLKPQGDVWCRANYVASLQLSDVEVGEKIVFSSLITMRVNATYYKKIINNFVPFNAIKIYQLKWSVILCNTVKWVFPEFVYILQNKINAKLITSNHLLFVLYVRLCFNKLILYYCSKSMLLNFFFNEDCYIGFKSSCRP